MLTTLADLDNTYGAPGTTTYCYGIGRQGSHGNAHSGAGGASSLLRTCENVSQTEPTGLLLVAGGGGGGSAAGATFDGHSGGSGGIASGWGTAGFKQGSPQITGDTGSGGSQDMVGGGAGGGGYGGGGSGLSDEGTSGGGGGGSYAAQSTLPFTENIGTEAADGWISFNFNFNFP